MERFGIRAAWTCQPPLDPGFYPVEQFRRAYLATADREIGLAISGGGRTAVYHTRIHQDPAAADRFYIDRLVKTLLWSRGGCHVTTTDETVWAWLRSDYGPGGRRAFDATFMAQVYDRPFRVELTDRLPPAHDVPQPVSGRRDGCRIGFDAGGSDWKVAALRDGQVVYAREQVWAPKEHPDPTYHYQEVTAALREAAGHLPRVDGVGISSAGVQINDRTGNASLFIRVPPDVFDAQVRDLYLRAVRDTFGPVPCRVVNDGDVAALSGAMALGEGSVLGIAMGTSQAGGFVDSRGRITGWLNELAFVPVDVSAAAPRDDWSGDVGCGASCFSQDGVIRLAERAGLPLQGGTPAERLRSAQGSMDRGDERAAAVYESLGVWLGHALAGYATIYDCRHVLLLGRVVSGSGGEALLEACRRTLAADYPELTLALHLPDDETRRLGQAVAAACLPELK